MTIFKRFLLVVMCWANYTVAASIVEDYASLPEKSMMAISPDGSKIAYRQTNQHGDVLFVVDLVKKSVISRVDMSSVKPRTLFFLSNQVVGLQVTDNKRLLGYGNRYQFSALYAYNLTSNKVFQLLTRGYGIHPEQSSLGRVAGISKDLKYVYMPAYNKRLSYDLYRVALDKKRRPIVHVKGTKDTINILIHDGEAMARERYDDKNNIHIVEAFQDGSWKEIFRQVTEVRDKVFEGISADKQSIIVQAENRETQRKSYFKMSLADGAMSDAIFSHPNKDVESVILDRENTVLGVQYSGFTPDYEFFDDKLNARFNGLADVMPNTSIRINDYTPTWDRIVLLVEGDTSSGDYMLYNQGKLEFLTSARPNIPSTQVNPIVNYSYRARDGMVIPSLLTMPKAFEQKNLPAIVLPHGGPESYDRIRFDWLSQYFARRGFAVIQPQFRGSSGFGLQHLLAGQGEWGGKMQDDLTDAVTDLADKGIIDKTNVCIVGISYGGYAALAGAALTPGLYKCAISINGVSDIPRILKTEKKKYGADHWVLSYWQRSISADQRDNGFLKQISPINHVKQVESPILLIHGEHDVVVSERQSKAMYKALTSAGKSARLLSLDGGDHYLSRADNRLKALEAIDQFITQHIGHASVTKHADSKVSNTSL